MCKKARSPSASRPWPPPAAARPGLMAPRSASMALQASAPGELCGALGRLGYLWLPDERRSELFKHSCVIDSHNEPAGIAQLEPVSMTPRLRRRSPAGEGA